MTSSTSCSVSGRGTSARAVAEKGSTEEFSRPEKVLQGFSCSPISDQPAKRRSLCFRQRTVEFEIEVEPFFTKDVRE